MKISISLFTIFLILTLAPSAFAQSFGNGAAISVSISEKDIQDGDIISLTKEGYKRSTIPYDDSLFGVVNLKPALFLQDEGHENDTPVITQGKTIVRVSTINGPIKKGEFITSSRIPGVGQKATDNGNVLGMAEESYTEKDTKKIGTIYVTLNPHFLQLTNNITHNFSNAFRAGINSAFQTPLGALRYIAAAFIAIMSFIFGFRFFASTSKNGVEAIGRNPLASKVILLSVGINTMITITIMLLGVALGYLILVL